MKFNIKDYLGRLYTLKCLSYCCYDSQIESGLTLILKNKDKKCLISVIRKLRYCEHDSNTLNSRDIN